MKLDDRICPSPILAGNKTNPTHLRGRRTTTVPQCSDTVSIQLDHFLKLDAFYTKLLNEKGENALLHFGKQVQCLSCGGHGVSIEAT